MKACPYCAEEIQDEAIKCRHCGSWLPGSEGVRPAEGLTPTVEAPAQGAVPGQGALRFSHSGERYVLGFGDTFFGIWDRVVPGGPVYSFPRTDDGWQEAWQRFVALEPRAIEVPPPAAGSTSAPAWEVPRA